MTISPLAAIGITVTILIAILVSAYNLRRIAWILLEFMRPIAEGIGRGIEHIFKRPLPPAASYDILCHIILLIPFSLYALVVAITQNQDLITHLPIFVYLYICTTILSFGIAFVRKLRW